MGDYKGLTDKECNYEHSIYRKKIFTAEQIEELFLSVKWISGKYPDRLYRALLNSSTVITAWDNKRLVGLVRVLDDGGMVAYIHYVLVHPDYHLSLIHI